jgi:hypothetical protein
LRISAAEEADVLMFRKVTVQNVLSVKFSI